MLAFLEGDGDGSVPSLALRLFEVQWQNSHVKVVIKQQEGGGLCTSGWGRCQLRDLWLAFIGGKSSECGSKPCRVAGCREAGTAASNSVPPCLHLYVLIWQSFVFAWGASCSSELSMQVQGRTLQLWWPLVGFLTDTVSTAKHLLCLPLEKTLFCC